MGFNKKMYTCEVCGHTFIGEGNFEIICDKKDCKKNKKIESVSIQIPKKDIRVIGC